MARWFTALLYALMLACAGVPAAASPSVEQALQQMVLQSADAPQAAAEPLRLLAAVVVDDLGVPDESPQQSPQPTGEDEGAAELSELFFGARPLVLPEACAMSPPGLQVRLTPAPFLDGPQRPPRSQAVLAA